MALLNHFTHNIPNHSFKLNEGNSIKEFVCSACETPGFGPRYECSSCTFTLHLQCAHCPNETAPFFMHDAHPLSLKHHPAVGTVSCNVCQEHIRGIFYRCRSGCDFDVHPLCRLLPEDLQSVPAHRNDHRMRCVVDGNGTSRCAVCEEPCELWRYRCVSGCRVDVHVECIG